jgi:hypothetical protein
MLAATLTFFKRTLSSSSQGTTWNQNSAVFSFKIPDVTTELPDAHTRSLTWFATISDQCYRTYGILGRGSFKDAGLMTGMLIALSSPDSWRIGRDLMHHPPLPSTPGGIISTSAHEASESLGKPLRWSSLSIYPLLLRRSSSNRHLSIDHCADIWPHRATALQP